MVSEVILQHPSQFCPLVLILIVVEYGLGAESIAFRVNFYRWS